MNLVWSVNITTLIAIHLESDQSFINENAVSTEEFPWELREDRVYLCWISVRQKDKT